MAIGLGGCGKGVSPTEQEPDREAYSRSCSDTLACSASDGTRQCQEDYLPTNDQRHLEEPIDYAVYPPAGGPHYRCWWDWGVFTEAVPEERWVHNQEHGGVVFLYNCPDGCDAEVEQLVSALGDRERVIISPNTNMAWRFAASAWEYRIMMNCLDIAAMESFYESHFANGPEDVASMAPSGCMEDEADSGAPDTGSSGSGR